MFNLKKIIIFYIYLIGFNFSYSLNLNISQIEVIKAKASEINYKNIPVLVLKGNTTEMGIQYGNFLKNHLKKALKVLEEYYINQSHLTYGQLLKQANLLYNNFPLSYQLFMQGEAVGSGLNISDIKILNAMETLGVLLPKADQVQCAFLFLPPSKTFTKAALIGRNYDYPAPFDTLAQYLTVTILKETNKVPTAFISIAGEIYCPSCINAKGIFMELNNGSPSGGNIRNIKVQSSLIRMLTNLQNSKKLPELVNQLNNTQADFSLIINVTDKDQVASLEFSSYPILGMHSFFPNKDQTFSSTNFFTNPVWGISIPSPTDQTSWYGVTRRNNLSHLASSLETFNIDTFKALMETPITKGGALWEYTIYQLILDESDLSLYIRILKKSNEWVKIPLNYLFSIDKIIN